MTVELCWTRVGLSSPLQEKWGRSFQLIRTEKPRSQMTLGSCHIPLWGGEIHRSPEWSVRKTDGARDHGPAHIFGVWLLPCRPGSVLPDWSHSSHYFHRAPEWQFVSNLSFLLRCRSPHERAHTHTHTFMIGWLFEIGTLFRKSFHIHVPDWLYCVSEWWL